MNTAKANVEAAEIASGSPAPANDELPQAWVQIENGRYMPQRVRGSCLGRELG
jgi:hypothetical protein